MALDEVERDERAEAVPGHDGGPVPSARRSAAASSACSSTDVPPYGSGAPLAP